MNNFWMKMAIFAVIIIALIVLVKSFSGTGPKEKAPVKTVYDTWKEDDKRLRAEPGAEQQSVSVQTESDKQTEVTPQKLQAKQTTSPAKRQFRELSQTDKIEAERLFEVALSGRKLGRLPGPGYKLMVDTCRQIIEKFPGSDYEYKAKRMLADIPEQYRKRYNITEEEIDLSK